MSDQKVAIVTGGGKGIGKAIAKKLASEGYFVIINYNGSEQKAKETEQEILAEGFSCCTMRWNVSDYHACGEVVKDIIDTYKRIDVLVNNAGITKDSMIMKLGESDFDQVISVNLKGTYNMIQQTSRQFLKQRSGRIINISSVTAIIGNKGQSNYCASKAGVIGLTKSVARELGSRGITVNAVAPGFIDTDMTNVLPDSVKEDFISQIPLNKVGSTIDVANTVSFLASDNASYITGQVIAVDGGMTM